MADGATVSSGGQPRRGPARSRPPPAAHPPASTVGRRRRHTGATAHDDDDDGQVGPSATLATAAAAEGAGSSLCRPPPSRLPVIRSRRQMAGSRHRESPRRSSSARCPIPSLCHVRADSRRRRGVTVAAARRSRRRQRHQRRLPRTIGGCRRLRLVRGTSKASDELATWAAGE